MSDKQDEIDEWIWETFTNTWMRDENGDFVAIDDRNGVEHEYIKQAILTLKKKWLMEELTILGDKLYDITDIDWGIPTKWSIEQFNKEHADLWIPQKAVDLLISNRIKALNGDK